MKMTADPRRQQTKIVATISDRNCDAPFLSGLIERGVNVFRINTAHQMPDTTKTVVQNIRAVSESVGILIDTKGPEIRTREIEAPVEVQAGDIVAFSGAVGEGIQIPVSYDKFADEVPVGAQILIDDGEVSFRVEEKSGDKLLCRAENPGAVKNKKSVNVPGVHLDLPALTEKDKAYVQFSKEEGVDFIAHSFVRNAQDILDIKELLGDAREDVKIIAKIENREGVNNLDEILDEAYGVMVARGDLGIEIPAEEVPTIQKQMIRTCVARSKPVITATQMLHTMIENPRPTRAEVSDIANAVHDGTDALMLSGETAYGDYPFEAVETMSRVARAAEANRISRYQHDFDSRTGSARTFLAKTAIKATEDLPMKAIVVHTYSGMTARVVSSFRGHTPVYVTCHDKGVARELSLSYGIYPRVVELPETTDQLVASSMEALVNEGVLSAEDMVLIMAGSPPLKSNKSNMIEINTVGNCLQSRK